MSNLFLFELGTEEIPAGMVNAGLNQLESEFAARLTEHNLSWQEIKAWCSPRRLAIFVEGLPERQEDQEEIITGPPASVAFDSDGNPTKAAEGFARKLNVDIEKLEITSSEKGDYVTVRKRISGRSTPEILGEITPEVIGALNWPKNMYWSPSRFRFVRPLRWLTALWNDQVIPFSFEGIDAGRKSRGHRFLGEAEFEIAGASHYLKQLKINFVIADPEERKRLVIEGLQRESGDLKLVSDHGLLETVIHLNEFPAVLKGKFDRKFLEIPQEVLVTVMRFHQKYFSLADKNGSLAPYFLTVINNNGDPSGGIRSGHEKVLQARLQDAAFFWETDQNVKIENRIDSLGSVLFQEKLGSYLDKTNRITRLCQLLDPANHDLTQAARLCKTDLTTEMVRELSELQGVMGGLYARNEGYPEEVWRAIYEHYQPINLEDRLPENRNGKMLSVADRLDTLAGCFSIGIIPSGSSDPFALRRQAQGLVLILRDLRLEIPGEQLLQSSLENFPVQNEAIEKAKLQLWEFIGLRIQFLLQRDGYSLDVVRAVMAAGTSLVHDVWDRAEALQQIKIDPDFEALAAAFKRSRNILEQGEGESEFKESLLTEEAEKELFKKFSEINPLVCSLVEKQEYLEALKVIASIRNSVDRFFDEVMVMVEDRDIRNNRMSLLRTITTRVLSIADISEIAH